MIEHPPFKLPPFGFIAVYLYLQVNVCSLRSAFLCMFYLYISLVPSFPFSSQPQICLHGNTLPEKSS